MYLRGVARLVFLPVLHFHVRGLSDAGITLHATLVEGLKALDPERHGLISGEIKRRLELDMEVAYQGSTEPKHAALWLRMQVKERIVDAKRLGKRLQLLKDKQSMGCGLPLIGTVETFPSGPYVARLI